MAPRAALLGPTAAASSFTSLELVCAMDPVAEIETEDGAQVRLEARGYGRRQSTQHRFR